MKTFVIALVVVVVTAMVEVDGRTAVFRSDDDHPCPPYLFHKVDGECVPVPEYEELISSGQRHKRQAQAIQCPHCATGVWDLYPDWSDCSKINYCLNGNIIPLNCSQTGGLYFNPTTKQCEMVASSSNNCVFRNFNLLSVQG